MNLSVALRLGRVSNLPTVWSNTFAGIALGGGELWTETTLLVAAGLSLLYAAGMFLNDAFDRDMDALERPTRPIPAGEVSANTVFAAGFGLMLAGLATIASASRPETAVPGVLAALALAGAIVFYNWHHKGNPLSPVFMGLCRLLAYLTAGLAVAASATGGLWLAALVSLGYLIGLTYTAKQEALDRLDSLWPLAFLASPVVYGLVVLLVTGWSALLMLVLAGLVAWIGFALFLLKRRNKGDVPKAVVSLIAGIALVDAVFFASLGEWSGTLAAAIFFVATLGLQRWVSGT